MRNVRRQRGAAMVWVVVLLSVLLGFGGLAVDTWHTSLAADQLQISADAAALAAARYVAQNPDAAREVAAAIAAANMAAGQHISLDLNLENLEDGDIVLGFYNEELNTFV